MHNTNTFTVSEKIAMLKINQLSHNILTMTLDDLARELSVSTATINRTFKKMGYKNLKDYKLSIDIPKQIIPNTHISSQEEELISLIYNFDSNLLNTVIEDIYYANTIYIVAFGLSTSLGLEMSTNLKKLNKNTVSVNDSEILTFINERMLQKNDICIYISHSGEDIDMINFSTLNKHNLIQVLISSTNECELATLCNYTLPSNVSSLDEQFKSRISLNIITNKILENYSLRYTHK